ncbi:MAG: 16S rRNA (uracil(1498)-N(3))-methyltransferase [Fibrobacterota bacterium]|nr:16S rRNA (uracil(1498)-N(3))-methyltransferase [Fibrobacterota bacterium]QQS04020.1 MAG: 16S rRNA (uracil(1498)-N(3))-methyltransferase [Fibrobacterota bacterium]
MSRTYDETWIYHPSAAAGTLLELDDSESGHLIRVLRLAPQTLCTVTDGRGQVLNAVLEDAHPRHARLQCLDVQAILPEPKLALAQAILKNRGLEDVVDLCCQTPLRKLQPLWTDHVQVARNRDIDHQIQRLQAKAIAALQQSKQAWLCEIPSPLTLDAWLATLPSGETIAVCDATGSPTRLDGNASLVVGPEGGFSTREFGLFEGRNLALVSLGNSRLRATAAGFWALGRLG